MLFGRIVLPIWNRLVDATMVGLFAYAEIYRIRFHNLSIAMDRVGLFCVSTIIGKIHTQKAAIYQITLTAE